VGKSRGKDLRFRAAGSWDESARGATLRTGTAGSQDESPCGAIHKIAIRGGLAYAAKRKFVSNRKWFLLCFHWNAHENDDFVRLICIE
jgi:hypothetical protein